MFGYIKKDKVLEIVQRYYESYDEMREKELKRVFESATSDEGLDQDAARGHLAFSCVRDAVYIILKEIEKL